MLRSTEVRAISFERSSVPMVELRSLLLERSRVRRRGMYCTIPGMDSRPIPLRLSEVMRSRFPKVISV